jgi:hypothetical protein
MKVRVRRKKLKKDDGSEQTDGAVIASNDLDVSYS